jgi:predicted TIM-barrel fold metal-dependent hydrolase
MKLIFTCLLFLAFNLSTFADFWPDSRNLLDVHVHVGCIDKENQERANTICSIKPREKCEKARKAIRCMTSQAMQKAVFGRKSKAFEFIFGLSNADLKDSPNGLYEVFFHVYRNLEGGEYKRYAKIFGLGDLPYKKTIKIRPSTAVKNAVVFAFDRAYSPTGKAMDDKSDLYISNDFVIDGIAKVNKIRKKYSARLLFGASVHPYRRDAIQELRRVARKGAILVKLIPSIQHFHPYPPNSQLNQRKKLVRYYKELARLGLPLLIHVDEEGSFAHSNEKYASAWKLELALKQGVTVIVAHAAGRGMGKLPESKKLHSGINPPSEIWPGPFVVEFYRKHSEFLDSYGRPKAEVPHFLQLEALMKKYPKKVYVDISAMPIISPIGSLYSRVDMLDRVVNSDLYRGKILYGSDYPLNHKVMNMTWFTGLRYFKTIFRNKGISKDIFTTVLNKINSWDRDVWFKEALGFDVSMLANYCKVFPQLRKKKLLPECH